ncbi:MAG: exo-alpha-sialidase [Betaproteobacteria bacterium]|nr:exo-alpha-sialidase [Betaproteobacteria bacterium]
MHKTISNNREQGQMSKISLGFFLVAMCLGWTVRAADQPIHAGHRASPLTEQEREKKWKDSLAKPSLAITAVFDEKGRLWRVLAQERHVLVSHSDDGGKSYSHPVKVNAEPEDILGDGENRPKIVVRKGVVYVSYTQGLAKPMTGYIRFSRSVDGGETFAQPVTVNDNLEIISHRFETMGVYDRGQVFLAWLDKRDLSAATKKGEKYIGLGVYYAVSDDNGANFNSNVKAAEHACECCRMAMAMDTDGTPVIAWRHVFGKNVRDHAMLRLDGKSQPIRLSHDNWEVDACPHHGPAASIARDGVYHFVWFNNAPERHGLFYAHSSDQGGNFSSPLNFGNFKAQASHPTVLSLGKRVFIAWKEFDGEATGIYLMHSIDGGNIWSAPRKIVFTADTSDHPILIGDGEKAYLSWNTIGGGHHLIALPEGMQ